MARITDTYIRTSFMRQFARMTPQERKGAIEGLAVVHEAMLAVGQQPLPFGESAPSPMDQPEEEVEA
jgi:hypothetical protein